MKIKDRNYSLRVYLMLIKRRVESLLRIVIIPGFEGVPLYDVLVYFIKGFTKVNLIDRAASVAFNVFLSIFPFILFLFTLLPYMPLHGVTNVILEGLQTILPPGTYEKAAETIEEIMSVQRGGLMSLGLLLAFYFSTSAVSSFFRSFNLGDESYGKISFIKEQIYSIIVTMMFVGLIIISIVLIMLGNNIVPKEISENTSAVYRLFINVLRWIIIIFALVVAISILYHFGNPRRKRFRLFSPGTLLFTGMFIVGTVAFNYYISNISSYNILYGSIGALLIFLIWVYFNCILILIGYELNKSITKAQSETLMLEDYKDVSHI